MNGWQPFDGGEHSRNYCGECGQQITRGVKLWEGLVAKRTLCIECAEAEIARRESEVDVELQR